MDEHRIRINDSYCDNQLGKKKQIKPNFLTLSNCNYVFKKVLNYIDIF